MKFERPVGRPFEVPVEPAQLFEHLRVSGQADLEAEATRLAIASGWEIEDRAQIALLTQTITAFAYHPRFGQAYHLPVGPVLSGASVSVSVLPAGLPEAVLQNGQFLLRPGLRAIIYLIDDGNLPFGTCERQTLLKISYQAGFGSDPANIPPDLAQAVMDQAASAFDWRGGRETKGDLRLSPHAARIIANYRGVAV